MVSIDRGLIKGKEMFYLMTHSTHFIYWWRWSGCEVMGFGEM